MSPLLLSAQPRFSFLLPSLQCSPIEDQWENGHQAPSKALNAMNTTPGTANCNSQKELAFLRAESAERADDGYLGRAMKTEEPPGPKGAFVKQEAGKLENAEESAFCGGELMGQEEGGQQNGQMDQTDIYRELILRHLIADISGTCTKLGLPNELAAWTGDDCRRWVAEMCAQFQLNVPSSDAFMSLNGRKMLALGVEEFQTHFPAGGDTLHAQLQLWKTAFESCGQFNGTSPFGPQYGFSAPQQSADHPNGTSPQANGGAWLVSPSPADNFASAPSSCSSASQYSSNSNANFQHFHPPPQHYYPSQNVHFHQNHQYSTQPFVVQSGHHQKMPPLQCAPPAPAHLIGPRSDCSATESVSSTQQDDSSSVAEEDFLGQNSADDISQHFFLSAPHQQQHPMLSATANFCHQFPANNPQFPPQISASQGGHHPSHQNQPIQQHQRLTGHGTGGTIHLWHFIRELLEQPKEYGGCVRWVDRKEGTFKIESSHHLARYWGIRKNRSAMNYDKLSRSLRQYYKKGIIQKPEKKQRLVYKFLPPYNQ